MYDIRLPSPSLCPCLEKFGLAERKRMRAVVMEARDTTLTAAVNPVAAGLRMSRN